MIQESAIYNFILYFPKAVKSVSFFKNEFRVLIHSSYLLKIMQLLKQHTLFQFTELMDITAIDYPKNANRFTVVYTLLSLPHNSRVLLKLETNETNAIESLTPLYNSANWLEREVWDMFGIFFLNHPDLRRILTDYGFDGFPMRKDFPLTGYIELRYEDSQKRVISEPVELSQEYRFFDFSSPWEQT